MIREQGMVKKFHEGFEVGISDSPKLLDEKTQHLREKLIFEEYRELKEAFNNQDIVEVADALADLLYVIYGTAVSCGIDMEPVFDEVHRSNMTKIPADGKIVYREDGKVIKPDSYSPPNLIPVINSQYANRPAK